MPAPTDSDLHGRLAQMEELLDQIKESIKRIEDKKEE